MSTGTARSSCSSASSGAIVLAVGHHVLNLTLDGRPVSAGPVEQQWVSRAGNALAYLVKVVLVLATGTAYVQCSPSSTPGTISVVSASTSEPKTITVPQREYGKTSYGVAMATTTNVTVFYGVDGFFGPAISCSAAGVEVTTRLTDLVLPYHQQKQVLLMYDAWVPRPATATSPNETPLVDGMLVVDPDRNSNLRILDQISSDAARIYYSIAPDVTMQATMTASIHVIECGSAMCILVAMIAISKMDAVYSNSFSTVVRVSRNQPRLNTVICDDHDHSGAQPLPKRVADAYMWIGREDIVSRGIGRGRVATADIWDSDTEESRSWWRKRRAMDLERPLLLASWLNG
ncbi:hypothetical protein AYO21_03071 [Fonsecaea monophora]|uniref:Uncharacterized protein n=1 Tax=Fonsecaea monophora TaxID=254056 RepID=A0A177FF15_9EURO|nr:hypothetical protein AYO21_03071 [Fonsecaea monophora]OAG42788.1 hypothetical protein AYO21_03071 [Fonsecaea monophora]